MSSTVGGGAATITRFARTLPRPVCTTAWPSRWVIRCTGAASATMSPSRFASRSGISCEPPTNGAPARRSRCRSCGRRCRRCARCPSTRRTRARRGTTARSGRRRSPGWVQARIRFSTPCGVDGVAADPLAERHRVPLGRPRVRPRGVDRDLGGVLVDPGQQQRGVGEDRRVRRDGALVLQPPRGRGDVDAVAVDVLVEGADVELAASRRMWFWVGPTNAPPDSIVAPCVEVVVEHPAADASAGLDQQHRPPAPGDLARGDQAGDAAADHDHVDLGGQRALEGPGGRRVGRGRRAPRPPSDRPAPPSSVRRERCRSPMWSQRQGAAEVRGCLLSAP